MKLMGRTPTKLVFILPWFTFSFMAASSSRDLGLRCKCLGPARHGGATANEAPAYGRASPSTSGRTVLSSKAHQLQLWSVSQSSTEALHHA